MPPLSPNVLPVWVDEHVPELPDARVDVVHFQQPAGVQADGGGDYRTGGGGGEPLKNVGSSPKNICSSMRKLCSCRSRIDAAPTASTDIITACAGGHGHVHSVCRGVACRGCVGC